MNFSNCINKDRWKVLPGHTLCYRISSNGEFELRGRYQDLLDLGFIYKKLVTALEIEYECISARQNEELCELTMKTKKQHVPDQYKLFSDPEKDLMSLELENMHLMGSRQKRRDAFNTNPDTTLKEDCA